MHIYSLITKKRSQRYNELVQELPATCLPYQGGGIPLSAFPNDTTSKLARLLFTLPLFGAEVDAERQAGKL